MPSMSLRPSLRRIRTVKLECILIKWRSHGVFYLKNLSFMVKDLQWMLPVINRKEGCVQGATIFPYNQRILYKIFNDPIMEDDVCF
jgi:hypothetical protein